MATENGQSSAGTTHDEDEFRRATRNRTPGLVYCSSTLPPREAEIISGRMGWDLIGDERYADDGRRAAATIQAAVVARANDPRWRAARPSFAFVTEGPYFVPMRA